MALALRILQHAARGVNVVAMFSEGIEPSHVEGGQHSINDGRVAFRTIDNLAAGSETVRTTLSVLSVALLIALFATRLGGWRESLARPSDPPRLSGLPVTTPGTVWPWLTE